MGEAEARPSGGRPPEDRELSPFTGWTRAHWEALADDLLDGVLPHRSPGGARYDVPGPRPGANGPDMDGLEGFARTFLLAAFRLAHAQPARRDELAERYSQGLRTGVDPTSPEAWPVITDDGQAMVEAASVALALAESRPWVWDRLEDQTRARLVTYLSAMTTAQCGIGNWLLFRVVVLTFLESVGHPVRAGLVDGLLAAVDQLYRGDGWYADGGAPGDPQFDYYTGWALHLYTLWWGRAAAGPDDPRSAEHRRRARRHVETLLHMVGGDGGPVHQGRSLTYRAAVVTPVWALLLAGEEPDDVELGRWRRAASGVARHFVDNVSPGPEGTLALGWYGEFLPAVQDYSGPASPYWASKAFLGLLLPPDHRVWSVVEQPLPVEVGDFVRHEQVPGWLLAGTEDDGVVRLLNHGTSRDLSTRDPHSRHLLDDPHYCRAAYSTRTGPCFPQMPEELPDNWAGYLDHRGRPTFRGRILARIPPSPAAAAFVTGQAALSVASAVETLRRVNGRFVRMPSVDAKSEVLGGISAGVELRTFTFVATGEWQFAASGWCLASDDGVSLLQGDSWAAVQRRDGTASLLVDLSGGGSMEVAETAGTAYGSRAALPTVTWPAAAAAGGKRVVRLAVYLGVPPCPLDAWAHGWLEGQTDGPPLEK